MRQTITEITEAYEKDRDDYRLAAAGYNEARPLALHRLERNIQVNHYDAIRIYVYREAIEAYFASTEGMAQKRCEPEPVRYPGGDRIIGGFAVAMQIAANVAEEPIYTIAELEGNTMPFTYAFVPGGNAEIYELATQMHR